MTTRAGSSERRRLRSWTLDDVAVPGLESSTHPRLVTHVWCARIERWAKGGGMPAYISIAVLATVAGVVVGGVRRAVAPEGISRRSRAPRPAARPALPYLPVHPDHRSAPSAPTHSERRTRDGNQDQPQRDEAARRGRRDGNRGRRPPPEIDEQVERQRDVVVRSGIARWRVGHERRTLASPSR